MTIKVLDTSGWQPWQLDPYWPEIFAAMMKLKAKLPDDISISVLLAFWAQGRRKLWLILDDDRFLAFGMTEIETNLATGKRFVTLKDMAGEGVVAAHEEICTALEAYADSEGIEDRRIQGLDAWKRPTKPHGYETHSILLRKVVTPNG